MTGVVLVMALAGCTSSDDGNAPGTSQRASDPATADAPSVSVESLPLGDPPRGLPYIVDDVLHWRGREITFQLPGVRAGVGVTMLGSVDGRMVVTNLDRFWAIDPNGQVQQLGHEDYSSYDYTPRLVASTGHIWVHYTDRTSPRTLWEIDARTGQDIAVYRRDALPTGLAPADQALIDAWVERRDVIGHSSGTLSPDRSLLVIAGDAGTGSGARISVIRGNADKKKRTVAAQFFFEPGLRTVDQIYFEDDDHFLALVWLQVRGRPAAIIRCSVSTRSCERATDVVDAAFLGTVRPTFREK